MALYLLRNSSLCHATFLKNGRVCGRPVLSLQLKSVSQGLCLFEYPFWLYLMFLRIRHTHHNHCLISFSFSPPAGNFCLLSWHLLCTYSQMPVSLLWPLHATYNTCCRVCCCAVLSSLGLLWTWTCPATYVICSPVCCCAVFKGLLKGF